MLSGRSHFIEHFALLVYLSTLTCLVKSKSAKRLTTPRRFPSLSFLAHHLTSNMIYSLLLLFDQMFD